MQPMSIGKRRFYLIALAVIFVLLIPYLLLKTSGYRITPNLEIVKTGGIYVTIPEGGAEIYVNNKLEKTTNIIQKYFFGQNLIPGTYFVFVNKEGYSPWSKEVRVYGQIVSEAHAFMVPKNLEKTKILENEGRLSAVKNIFLKKPDVELSLTSKTASATSTILLGDLAIRRNGDALFAEWAGDTDESPYYLCDETKKRCLPEAIIFASPIPIKSFDFYPDRNDVVIFSRKNGIYAIEADRRVVQNFTLVYGGEDVDFRIGSDGNFYLRDGDEFYEVEI